MKPTSSVRSLIITFAAFGSLTLAACATGRPSANIASDANPRDEIATLENQIAEARASDASVLGRTDFKKSEKFLDEAKSDLKKGESNREVIDDLRRSKAHLADAYAAAEKYSKTSPAILEARQKAIAAGAFSHSQTKSDMDLLDERVGDFADRLDKTGVRQLTQFQDGYVDIEKRATVITAIGDAEKRISDAKEDRAARLAPRTLKKAQLSYEHAESVINTNVRTPDVYASAAAQANADALLLADVIKAMKSNKRLNETAALKQVAQNREIASLKTNLKSSEAQVANAEAQVADQERTLADRERSLAEKQQALGSAEATVAVQKAIEESRSQFSADEAEAYQQGENLVIRLKSINFPSGKAEVPAAALPILERVAAVAKNLDAKEIKVEGHTDSIGSSQINKSISENRAEAVATYLEKELQDQNIEVEAEGMGFEKPIATNRSKEGRAQNRRVDVIITPSGTATVQ